MSVSSPLQPGRSSAAVAPALLERHRGSLRAYLATLPGAEPARVEQVVQETFAAAAAQAELEEDPAVWLFQSGRRRLLGSGQRGDIIGRGDEGVGDEAMVEGEDPRIAVDRTFGRLTTKQQEALRLKFQFGFGLDEFAHIAGIGRSAAGGLLHHAMERIGQAVRPVGADEAALIRDPRLVAFAFDELDDAEKQAFVESAADGKRLLEQTDALRKAGQVLTQVLTSGAPVPKRRRRGAGGESRGVVLGLLALLLLAGALAWWFLSRGTNEGLVTSGAAPPESEARARAGDSTRRSTQELRADAPDPAAGRAERELKPGEAEWERKAFGRGLAQGGGASGGLTGSPGGSSAANDGGADPGSSSNSFRGGAASDGAGPAGKSPVGASRGSAGMPGSPGQSPAGGAPRSSPAQVDQPIVLSPPGSAGGIGAGGGAGATAAESEPGRGREAQAAAPAKRPRLAPGELRPRLPRGTLPPKDQVLLGDWTAAANARLEPTLPGAPDVPLRVQADFARSPWRADRHLLRVAVHGRSAPPPARRPASLVFVIDVSDSMSAPNRLALVQDGIRRLADRLIPEDRVAVVTYAAGAKLALPSLPVGERALELRNALAGLVTSGKTNGSEGLRLGLDTARAAHLEGGANVVVLCTDGNFNLGDTEPAPLAALAAGAAADGVQLSVFGFGRSDRNDLRLELLAAAGRGRSCYVNTRDEAERLLAGQVDGLFAAAAVDVEIKLTFDPGCVVSVRRVDDPAAPTLEVKVPEVLPGRRATAWYELELREPVAGGNSTWAKIEVAYRRPGAESREAQAGEAPTRAQSWTRLDDSFRHGAALTELARILRAGSASEADPALDRLEAWVRTNISETGGYRTELLESIAAAREDTARL